VVLNQGSSDFADLSLPIHIGKVLKRKGLHLLRHRFQVSAAVVADYEAVLFQAFEVLPDSYFGDIESRA
jgi:hypothetical protein